VKRRVERRMEGRTAGRTETEFLAVLPILPRDPRRETSRKFLGDSLPGDSELFKIPYI
jgi:hypothetical protein